MEFHNYTSHQSDWVSFLIIAVVFIYGILHFVGAFHVKTIIRLLFSGDHSNKSLGALANILLSINTFAILGLFIFSGLAYIDSSVELNYLIFLRIVFGVLVITALQKLIIHLHSGLTNSSIFFTNYLSIQSLFANAAAILSIPLLVLSIYSNVFNLQLLIAGAAVFGGIYLFGIVKSIASSNRIKGALKFHLIFYLCGNEILPFLLFYKILI